MIFLIFRIYFSLVRKDTTKNAHTQVKLAIIFKKDRLIYLIRYTALAQARLKAKCWVADDKVKPLLQIFRAILCMYRIERK